MGQQRYDGEKLNSSVDDGLVMELEKVTGLNPSIGALFSSWARHQFSKAYTTFSNLSTK